MSLLQMSISGAIMIIAIIVVRMLAVNRLPKRAFLILWEIVQLRLLIPFSIPSRLSAYSFVSKCLPVQNVIQEGTVRDMLPQATTASVKIYDAVTPVIQNEESNISILLILWIVGIVLCASYFLISYFRCWREFQTSLPVNNAYVNDWLECHSLKRTIKIKQSDRISAPLTYGVISPVILMPKKTDWENSNQLQYVLMHEYIHICRFDAVFKLIATLVLCIHWFNPLVWVMYILCNRDIELVCDERVVRQFGDSSKVTYAMTLITMEEKKSGLTPLYNNFSKNAIEERITAIMKTRKLTIGLTAVSMVVIGVIVVLFGTSAKNEELDAIAKTFTVNQNVDEEEYPPKIIYEGCYFDGGVYQYWTEMSISESPMIYCEIWISNVTETTFQFLIKEVVMATDERTIVLPLSTAKIVNNGWSAIYEGEEFTLSFEFPDSPDKFPKEITVDGWEKLEGNTYMNKEIPGHESG